MKIDVPWLNTVLRERRLEEDSLAATLLAGTLGIAGADDEPASQEKLFFGHYDGFAKKASSAAGLVNAVNGLSPVRYALEELVGLDRRRAVPPLASATLVESAKTEIARAAIVEKPAACKAVLFADVFTNYSSPQRGLATLRVLHALGVDVVVSDAIPDGRAAFSQGLIATAAAQAQKAAALLESFIGDGREVIVVEPSVLAMFRLDYRHLLEGGSAGERLKQLREHTFDSMEFVEKVLAKNQISAAQFFPATESPRGTRIFYHSHCQQKTIGAAEPAERILRAAGFDVVTSQVECCGMAGSFGYKKDYYDLSMAVGRDLFAQVAAADADGPRVLVASGISCQEQLQAGMKRAVVHPMELLVETLSTRRRVFS